jgi:tetratricopeptide (TPR) repeat protein
MALSRLKARWWYWLGRFAVKRRGFPLAASYFQRSLTFVPDDLVTLFWSGYSLCGLGRFEEAAGAFRHALQQKPDLASAHAQLGRMLLFLDRPQEAIESITRAFRIQPSLKKYSPYQTALGCALGRVDRLEEGLAACREAVKANPKDVDALDGLAWALIETGNNSEALQLLRTAIKLEPDYAPAHEHLGTALRNLGRNEESIQIWQRLVELRPQDPDALASLGWAYGDPKIGRFREAIEWVQKAMDVDPSFPGYSSIGRYHAELGEYREAIEAERKHLATYQDADTYAVLGACLSNLHDYPGAIDASLGAVELDPNLKEAWANLSDAYLETGQFESSVECSTKAWQLGLHEPTLHRQLGLAYLKLGNLAAALEQCKTLHELDPTMEQELRDQIATAVPSSRT